ncbi:hypothetical protein WJX77_004692 [Trebouxia sp. C0004]
MEVDEAHRLYQQLQKVDAAAKQKQGLGFGASSPPRPDAELSKPSNGWEAPYKLSDKYQQPETNSRKRSRSPSHHKSHFEVGKRHRSRPASRSPQSPPQGNSASHKAKRSRRSGSREPERHHQTHKYHQEYHNDHDRRSRPHQSPHRHAHSSRDGDRSRRHLSHSSRQDSRHDSSHRRHGRARSRSRDQHFLQQQVSLEAYRHRRSDRSHHRRSRSRDKDRRSRDKDGRNIQEVKADTAPDYATLVTGYNSMGPTERLKAVMQYKLCKTSSKEPNAADGKPWTRFVFNNEALLDEEGAVPDGPGHEGSGQAGLGAFDFRQHWSVQSARPAEDAHEAAIFGAPAAQAPAGHDSLRSLAHATSSESDERPQVVELHEITAVGNDADPTDAVEPSAATQPKLSWRERALLKKQQAEGS